MHLREYIVEVHWVNFKFDLHVRSEKCPQKCSYIYIYVNLLICVFYSIKLSVHFNRDVNEILVAIGG